jgi:GtrA-like protein
MAAWRVFGPVDSYGRILEWKRLRRAVRRKENWAQLTIFCLVGAWGYVVNVALFAVYVNGLRFDPRIGALLAFLCAVGNNFVWNRRWTFPERDADAGRRTPNQQVGRRQRGRVSRQSRGSHYVGRPNGRSTGRTADAARGAGL